MIKLPAGLLDLNAEFFVDPQNTEICYAQTDGHRYRVNDLPARILVPLDADMAAHPRKLEALVLLGYETVEAQREKYCGCCFGGYDGEADFIEGYVRDGYDGQPDFVEAHFIHAEYWPCPHRDKCPVEGILCNALSCGNGKHLTKREVQVFMLIDLLDKEIADRLKISVETVKIHAKHIREKFGTDNKKELIKIACHKNLL